ncbi:MAG: hypothetical protein NVV62_16010 [Terricaulis sp.]|nr:hypothetical protein [Terricaulis sp.]
MSQSRGMSLAAQSAWAVAAALTVVAPGAAHGQGFQQNFQAGPAAPGRQILQPGRSTHIQQPQERAPAAAPAGKPAAPAG